MVMTDQSEHQIEQLRAEIRSMLDADPGVRARAIRQAERCRQSFLSMQATGSFDVLCAIRDQNTYEAIRRALAPETVLPAWSDTVAQITSTDSDETVMAKTLSAGYEPRRPRLQTQLWQECPACGREPIYLETGRCERCSE